MKQSTLRGHKRLPMKGLIVFLLATLALTLAAPAFASEGSGEHGFGGPNNHGPDGTGELGPMRSGDSGQNGGGDSHQYGPGDSQQHGPISHGPNGPHEGCKLHGSWLGYSTSTGDAWWMSTAGGQSAAAGTVVLEVPGFDMTLIVGDPPAPVFPFAFKATDLRGTWERIDANKFAYTVLGIVVDENGTTQYISKLTGSETLIDDCNTMFLENTALQIYAPQADPFADLPLIGPIPFPDHYGFRMKVDLP